MSSSTEGLEGLAFALGRDTLDQNQQSENVSLVETAEDLQAAIEQAQREGQLLGSIHQLLSECRKLAFDALNAPEGEPREIIQGHLREVLGLVDDIAEGRALAELDLTSAKGAVAAVTEIERKLAEISKQQWRLEELQKRKLLEQASVSAKQLKSLTVEEPAHGLEQLNRAILSSESGASEQVPEKQLALHEQGK